jgi:hypothetical protein
MSPRAAPTNYGPVPTCGRRTSHLPEPDAPRRLAVCATVLLVTAFAWRGDAQKPPQSLQMGGKKSVTRFFVTSRGLGRGGDLGGLAGADAHCQALAKAEGSDDHTWRAYLSTSATATAPAVNARDRIGRGPWYNALGDRIAVDVDELHGLHGGKNAVDAEHAVTERGDEVAGDRHDILTGSRPDGTAFPAAADLTCSNWTSSVGRAQVGHHDRTPDAAGGSSWNSAHALGCGRGDLLFYCFATD